jgi:micrococcal nuclease
MYTYKAELIKVVDGDTIDVRVDLGFKTFKLIRVRLLGINAPESRTRDKEEKVLGLASKERLKEILESNNNQFVLQSHGLGKFGRCLGELYINDLNVNQQLVKEGHAVEYYGGKR